MNLRSLSCCGMQEIEDLTSWNPDRFYQLMLYQPACAYIIFNGVQSQGYVESFRAFILKHNLGEIVDLKSRVNPNFSNTLAGGVWHIDRPKLREWVVKEQLSRTPKVTDSPTAART